MSLLTNRKFRTILNRLFFGSLLSGVFLFQGTGYITSNLYGTTSENRNVSATTGLTVSDSTINVGLLGENGSTEFSTSGAIKITDGGKAAVGKLNTTMADISVTDAVDITLNDSGSVEVGVLNDTTQFGTLYLYGIGSDTSSVTMNSGSNFTIGSGGLVSIGTDKANGTLQLLNGSQLFNTGTQITDSQGNVNTYGLVINAKGQLILGTENAKTTGNTIEGDGVTQNSGTITLYNESGDANQAYFGVYGDDANASLTATGKVFVNGGTGTDGLITLNGELDVEEWEALNNTEFSSTSTIKIAELLSLGSSTAGASLTVGGGSTAPTTPNVTLGGMRLFSNIDTAGTPHEGILTLDAKSSVKITGLTDKLNAAGEVDADNGKYDLWLGSGFNLSGKLDTTSSDSTKKSDLSIFINGDNSTYKSIVNSTGSIIADNLTITGDAYTDGGTVVIENSGLLTVNGTLSLLSNDPNGKIQFIHKANSTAVTTTPEINNMTLSSNAIVTVGTSGSTTVSNFNFTDLTIEGTGLYEMFGAGTSEIDNLTINAATSDQIVLTTADTSCIVVNNLNLNQGVLKLDSDYTKESASGLVAMSSDAIFRIGQADQAATSSAQIQIMGNDSTFIMGTVNLEGQGSIVQEAGHSLTFKDTTVNNHSQIDTTTGNYALSSDEIYFTGTGSYHGGKTISTNLMSFESGTSLNLLKDETLTITKDGNLELEKGATLNVEFDADSTRNSQIVLTGSGDATLASDSNLVVSNASDLATGTYTSKVISTETNTNTFDSTMKSTAFYTLTRSDTSTQDLNLTLDVHTNFASMGQTANQKAVGAAIDSFRTDENVSSETRTMLNNMMELDSTAEVAQAMGQLSAAGRANGMMLAMDNPWQTSFDQMGFTAHSKTPRMMTNDSYQGGSVYRGQQVSEVITEEEYYDGGYYPQPWNSGLLSGLRTANPRSLWGTVMHTSFNARSDDNSPDYGISRTGVALGYDVTGGNDWTAGINFNCTLPYLYTDKQHIDCNNFQLGGYLGHTFFNGVQFKGYVGGGFQQYTSKRTVEIENVLSDYYKDTYNGNSVAVSAQLSKAMYLSPIHLLRPLVQFDMQQVWLDGTSEETGAAALNYEKSDWNRSFVRGGFESEFNTDFMQITGRALYGYQLGGDNAPNMTATFVGAPGSAAMTIEGVDLGDSFVDFGVGALGYLDCARHWGISGNYDFVTSKKSTAHTGAVSLAYNY